MQFPSIFQVRLQASDSHFVILCLIFAGIGSRDSTVKLIVGEVPATASTQPGSKIYFGGAR